VIEKGWMEIYRYARTGDKALPKFEQGKHVNIDKVNLAELETQPPKRYSKAMLLSELEKRDLGTKATRAAIIDTLFKRGYIDGAPIRTTGFGMSVYKALNDNVSMIVEEETTRQLEKDMEEIVQGKKSESEVVNEGKQMLIKALKEFDANKDKISKAMQQGLSDSTPKVGKCPKDGGDLIMRRSRAGKQFVACANYPKCTQTFSVPQYALIIPMGKECEKCGMPVIKVARKGKGAFEMCLNPDCETKAGWKKKETKPGEDAIAKPEPAKKKAKPKKAVPVAETTINKTDGKNEVRVKKVKTRKRK
jgi:DNA topoisomerase-1